MIEDPIPLEDAQPGGWEVFALFTDLQGAVLTTLVGEAALAGTLDLGPALTRAANEARFDASTEVSP